MRRGLAGLLFFVSAILFALAAGGWWLQRAAFDPEASPEIARAVVNNDLVRAELAEVVAEAAAETVGVPADQLAVMIDAYIHNPRLADDLEQIVADAHARLIGARDEPVRITGSQMVPIVRHEVVADLPPVVLPVEQIAVLDSIRTGLRWFVPMAALGGLVALVLGILAHPQRADAIFGIGVFSILAAVLVFLLGYVVPAFALPALSDNPWIEVVPAVAEYRLNVVVGVSVGLAVVGVVLVLASAGFRGRRSRGWSSPVTTSRYREQRRWS